MSGIIAGNTTIYDERVKERLSCKICNDHNVPSFGGIPNAKPFQCLHYFHPQCVSNWNKWGLITGICSDPFNVYFYCGSKICNTYNDLYDCDWNLDATVTREICNRRCRMGLDINKAAAVRDARSSVSEPNNPNIVRDDRMIYSNITKISMKKRHVYFYSSRSMKILPLLFFLLL